VAAWTNPEPVDVVEGSDVTCACPTDEMPWQGWANWVRHNVGGLPYYQTLLIPGQLGLLSSDTTYFGDMPLFSKQSRTLILTNISDKAIVFNCVVPPLPPAPASASTSTRLSYPDWRAALEPASGRIEAGDRIVLRTVLHAGSRAMLVDFPVHIFLSWDEVGARMDTDRHHVPTAKKNARKPDVLTLTGGIDSVSRFSNEPSAGGVRSLGTHGTVCLVLPSWCCIESRKLLAPVFVRLRDMLATTCVYFFPTLILWIHYAGLASLGSTTTSLGLDSGRATDALDAAQQQPASMLTGVEEDEDEDDGVSVSSLQFLHQTRRVTEKLSYSDMHERLMQRPAVVSSQPSTLKMAHGAMNMIAQRRDANNRPLPLAAMTLTQKSTLNQDAQHALSRGIAADGSASAGDLKQISRFTEHEQMVLASMAEMSALNAGSSTQSQFDPKSEDPPLEDPSMMLLGRSEGRLSLRIRGRILPFAHVQAASKGKEKPLIGNYLIPLKDMPAASGHAAVADICPATIGRPHVFKAGVCVCGQRNEANSENIDPSRLRVKIAPHRLTKLGLQAQEEPVDSTQRERDALLERTMTRIMNDLLLTDNVEHALASLPSQSDPLFLDPTLYGLSKSGEPIHGAPTERTQRPGKTGPFGVDQDRLEAGDVDETGRLSGFMDMVRFGTDTIATSEFFDTAEATIGGMLLNLVNEIVHEEFDITRLPRQVVTDGLEIKNNEAPYGPGKRRNSLIPNSVEVMPMEQSQQKFGTSAGTGANSTGHGAGTGTDVTDTNRFEGTMSEGDDE
jgi:hypothetical protein